MKSEIAIEHTTLGNGLRVVAAPDHAAPVVTVGVFYRVGSRLEPRGRSGFAHLFEHMMFQGSPNVPKGAHIKLINSSGGRANGSTGYDVTSYFEAVPSNTLERVLWLEADRMRALKVDADNLTNQRNVVGQLACILLCENRVFRGSAARLREVSQLHERIICLIPIDAQTHSRREEARKSSLAAHGWTCLPLRSATGPMRTVCMENLRI